MSVLVETSLGNVTIDLHCAEAPTACTNFLKLCKAKAYNGCLFYNVEHDFVVQTGDPTGTGRGGSSVYGLLYGEQARHIEAEISPALRHTVMGTVSFAPPFGSQWLITVRDDCASLDGRCAVFGTVVEGMEVVAHLNAAYTDDGGRPLADVRVLHTYVLVDPFPDPRGLEELVAADGGRSPERLRPLAETVPERLSVEDAAAAAASTITAHDAAADAAAADAAAAAIARSRAVVLEMIGDLPSADAAPPENVLFVAKLNPVTSGDDLALIFSRFGDVVRADIARDPVTGESLCYAFVEFSNSDAAEAAYAKMDGVLVDDRRIRVDFSQSVSGLWRAAVRGRGGSRGGGAIGGRGRGGLGGFRVGGATARGGFVRAGVSAPHVARTDASVRTPSLAGNDLAALGRAALAKVGGLPVHAVSQSGAAKPVVSMGSDRVRGVDRGNDDAVWPRRSSHSPPPRDDVRDTRANGRSVRDDDRRHMGEDRHHLPRHDGSRHERGDDIRGRGVAVDVDAEKSASRQHDRGYHDHGRERDRDDHHRHHRHRRDGHRSSVGARGGGGDVDGFADRGRLKSRSRSRSTGRGRIASEGAIRQHERDRGAGSASDARDYAYRRHHVDVPDNRRRDQPVDDSRARDTHRSRRRSTSQSPDAHRARR